MLDRNVALYMKAQIGKRYRHYKNKKEYTVIAIARHSETLEEMVVYRAEYESPEFGAGQVWVRPRAMFEETVTLSEGTSTYRFIEISNLSPQE